MVDWKRAFKVAIADPQNVSLETYKEAFGFLVPSNKTFNYDEVTYKFGLLFSFRGSLMAIGDILAFITCLLFCVLFTTNDVSRRVFMAIPLPEWVWPWNYLSRTFMLQQFSEGHLLLSKADVETYLKLCSFVSLIWFVLLIVMLFINIVIAGGYDLHKPAIILALVSALSVWAATHTLFPYASLIGPSIHDNLLIMALKKTMIISFAYFSLIYCLIVLLVQFKRRPHITAIAEGTPE